MLANFFKKLFGQKATPAQPFNYREYWEQRYCEGGDSGLGSYGQLAQYKADFINQLIAREQLETVVEFGSGDGNQLGLMNYPQFTGLDISPSAVQRCTQKFTGDTTRQFAVYSPGETDITPYTSDLALCLDVLYHIVDEKDFQTTLIDVFKCALRYVVLYTNLDAHPDADTDHIKWRDTLACLKPFTNFALESMPSQPFPEQSGAQFFVLRRLP